MATLRSREVKSKVSAVEDKQDSASSVDNDEYVDSVHSDDEETEIEDQETDIEDEHLNGDSAFDKMVLDDADDDTYEEANIHSNYFVAASQRGKRSKSTLNDIDLSCLQEANEANFAVHKKERKVLLAKYERDYFPLWYNLMNERFNIILYGFGSKKALLDKFREQWLLDERHCVIYGYFGELTMKHIVSSLKEPLKVEKSDEAALMSSASKMKHPIYIVIHSLDTLMTTDKKIKTFLRQLATTSNGKIRLIATVDHVNSGLLWSSQERHQLNWIWYATPTFESYTLERGYSNSAFNAYTNSAYSQYLTLSAIEHVYDSLTPNAKKIFILIAKHYLKDEQEKNDEESEEEDNGEMNAYAEGLTFATLYRKCREEFLVNSELTLRTQLTEFKDHKLVKSQKSSDGSETVVLMVDLHLVRNFVNKINE